MNERTRGLGIHIYLEDVTHEVFAMIANKYAKEAGGTLEVEIKGNHIVYTVNPISNVTGDERRRMQLYVFEKMARIFFDR